MMQSKTAINYFLPTKLAKIKSLAIPSMGMKEIKTLHIDDETIYWHKILDNSVSRSSKSENVL